MKVRDLIKLVERDGWQHVRTTGSHRHYPMRRSRA
jgi:predicted RNA binding protein YcfA (HicA-like mRNA interferase family)